MMNEPERIASNDNTKSKGSLINIADNLNDIIGIKEPIRKLIEVIEKGVGKITEAYFIKQRAKATAQKIEMIASTIGEKRNLVDSIEYKDENVKITAENSIQERALSRINYQKNKEQQNIENITSMAFEQLINEDDVSKESVDEDWIIRFFNMAKDVSNEDIQLIWGKILAGEIKQPKSFSLRTLEVLKNISTAEAKLFEQISHYSIKCHKSSFVKYNKEFFDVKNIYFEDFRVLKEMGIIHDIDSAVLNFSDKNILIYEPYALLVEETEVNNILELYNKEFYITAYTTIGEQLLTLIEPVYDESYFKMLVTSLLKDMNGKKFQYRSVKYSKIISMNEKDGTLRCDDMKDIPIDLVD